MRPARQALAVASVLVLATIFWLRPRMPSSNHLDVVAAGPRVPEHQIVETFGLALGPSFDLGAETTRADRLESLITALKIRYNTALKEPYTYPKCTLNLERFAHTLTKFRPVISIAINLHKSEGIIPALSVALLTAIAHLLEHNSVHISIFENGSDDHTQSLLADLASALQAIGVDKVWVHSSHMKSDFGATDRIVMLAELRNLALAPLLPYATVGTQQQGILVFINDVVTCASDILEVIHQQRLQDADLVGGVDWLAVEKCPPGIVAYDTWVMRGIDGQLPYSWATPGGWNPQSPNGDFVRDFFITQGPALHGRWLDGRPFPVYSNWGGMAVFKASLFTQEHVRFRSTAVVGWGGGSSAGALGEWGEMIATDGYLAGDCPGVSECEYIARDIWNLRLHQNNAAARIVLAPQSNSAYDVATWEKVQFHSPRKRRDGAGDEAEDLIDWENVRPPEMVVCVPSREPDGKPLGLWAEDNHMRLLPPIFKRNHTTTGD